MRINRFLIVGILVLIVPTLFLSFVSAEFWSCFEKGEVVHYCSNYKPDWTCGEDNGCVKCMSVYRENETCYIHGVWNNCNKIPQECTNFGNGSIDTQAPNLTIYSPEQNEVYTERSVLLDLEVNEESDIYYYDNIADRGIWTRVCTDCLGYSRERSFDEGLNNLTFKASDAIGNEAFVERAFFVDSKKPKISKIEPRNGWADGWFYVWFKEENPSSIFLYYGNNISGYSNNELDINECILENKKYSCSTNVSLNDYDGEEIEYWFNVSDIAGNSDSKATKKLKVDLTAPVVSSFSRIINGRYVTFNMSIIEENFDSAEYYDSSEARPRWRTLCSRLKDGICEKKVSFSRGVHFIDIQVNDEAGNSIGFPVPPIVIDY